MPSPAEEWPPGNTPRSMTAYSGGAARAGEANSAQLQRATRLNRECFRSMVFSLDRGEGREVLLPWTDPIILCPGREYMGRKAQFVASMVLFCPSHCAL